MEKKVNIRIVAMGSIISELDTKRIKNWKSELFNIEMVEERGYLPQKSDLEYEDSWAYSDDLLETELPNIKPSGGNGLDLTVYILDAPLEEDYYTRIICGNRILITYFDVRELLIKENIPLENYLISNIYTYVLLLLSKANSGQKPLLDIDDEDAITHDYRDSCIYDMCGNKEEIVYSCVAPYICGACEQYLTKRNVTNQEIESARKELKRLKRNRYYRIVHWLKHHPMDAFFLSCLLAVMLSVVAGGICESCSCFCKVISVVFLRNCY